MLDTHRCLLDEAVTLSTRHSRVLKTSGSCGQKTEAAAPTKRRVWRVWPCSISVWARKKWRGARGRGRRGGRGAARRAAGREL